MLPTSKIAALDLLRLATAIGSLADGSHTEFRTYGCQLHWFGTERSLEVLEDRGAVSP